MMSSFSELAEQQQRIAEADVRRPAGRRRGDAEGDGAGRRADDALARRRAAGAPVDTTARTTPHEGRGRATKAGRAAKRRGRTKATKATKLQELARWARPP